MLKSVYSVHTISTFLLQKPYCFYSLRELLSTVNISYLFQTVTQAFSARLLLKTVIFLYPTGVAIENRFYQTQSFTWLGSLVATAP